MSSVLIVVPSRQGQTFKIAQAIAGRMEVAGLSVAIADLDSQPEALTSMSPLVYMLVAGAPVIAGKFDRKMIDAVRSASEKVKLRRTAFFSVSLNAADPRPEARKEDDRLLREAIQGMDIQPDFVASIAGRLAYTKYNWFMRLIMRRISKSAGGPTDTSKDYEMTDWNQVHQFADAVVAGSPASEFATGVRLPVSGQPATR